MSFSVPFRLPWLLLVIVQSALGGNIAGLALNDTLNLAFLIPWTGDVPIGSSTAAGFTLGIQEVHNRQLLPGYTVDWQFRDTWCKPQQGEQALLHDWLAVQRYLVQSTARWAGLGTRLTGSSEIPGGNHSKVSRPGYTIDWRFRDTWCKPQQGEQALVHDWVAVQRYLV